MIILPKTKDSILSEEKRNIEKQRERFADFPLPDFYFNPAEKFNYDLSVTNIKLQRKDKFIQFHSPLNESRVVNFKSDLQPLGKPGRKVALILVMHWNGQLRPYNKVVSFLRNTAIPVSTFIHIPAGRSLNPGLDGEPDYDSVSPNINQTKKASFREIINLQTFAKALRNQLDFEEIGLFSYSIGSMYSIIASLKAPNLFDFGIFHLTADDFAESVLNGLATQRISKEIKTKTENVNEVRKFWEPISPGSYYENFKYLPRHTRIIQSRYDFVFGPNNVSNLSKKILHKRPDIELETVPTGHTTLGYLPIGQEVLWKDVKFIYKHTKMRETKRSLIFDR